MLKNTNQLPAHHRGLSIVLMVDTCEGKGMTGDPMRIVHTFYTQEGKLIGTLDPYLHEKETEEKV